MVIAGAAHQAMPERPCNFPPPPPDLFLFNFRNSFIRLSSNLDSSLSSFEEESSSESESDSESESESESVLVGSIAVGGNSGNSISTNKSRNQDGETVLFIVCVWITARPHRTTANGSLAPFGSAAGKFTAWYASTCNINFRFSIGFNGFAIISSTAPFIFRSIFFLRFSNSSFCFLSAGSTFFNSSFNAKASSSPSSSVPSLASFFAWRFKFGLPRKIIRIKTCPTGLTCSRDRDWPIL